MGGRQRLPYTFVENCAAAVRLAGSVPAAGGEAFNVVDDDPPTGNDLVRHYRRHGNQLRTVPVPGWGIGPLSRVCEWYHHWSGGPLAAAGHEVRVVSPVGWPGRRRPRRLLAPGAAARAGGPPVEYPWYFYPPKVLRGWYGSFMWRSVRGTVRRALAEFAPDCVL